MNLDMRLLQQKSLWVVVLVGFWSCSWSIVFAEAPSSIALARLDSLHIGGHIAVAESLATVLIADARAASDTIFLLPLVSKLGRLHACFGSPQKGGPLLAESMEMAEAQSDTLAQCDALRWLGYAADQQGRMDQAKSIYLQMNELARASSDRYHQAWSLVGLGYLAARQGRYVDAESNYRQAVDLFGALGQVHGKIWALNGLGASLQDAGNPRAAMVCYEEVTALTRQVEYPAAEALAENNRGELAFSQGDPGAALPRYRRALAIQLQMNQRQDAVITSCNLADCLIELGHYEEAEESLENLLEDCRQGGFADREPLVLSRVARLHYLQGRFHAAAATSRLALQRNINQLSPLNRAKHLVELSLALAAQDSNSAALSVLEDGYQRWGTSLGGEAWILLRLQLAWAHGINGRHHEALQALAGVEETCRQVGQKEMLQRNYQLQARNEAELGRKEAALVSLRTASQAWEAVRSGPANPFWREVQSGSGAGLAAAYALALLDEVPDGSTSQRVFDSFNEVQVFKARTMVERMCGSTDAKTIPSLSSAGQLMSSVLGKKELLLDFYLGRDQSLVFVLGNKGITFYRLPPEAEINSKAHLLRQLLAHRPGQDNALAVAEAAKQMGRLLFGGLMSSLNPGTKIIMVPDGALHLLPTPVLAPEGMICSRVPSATILSRLKKSHSDPPSKILAFATATTPDGQTLIGAQEEVRRLQSSYEGVEVFLAGNEPVLPDPEKWSSYRVLHLASHAEANDRTPWASSIFLGNEKSVFLRAEEIVGLPLQADLVVLSGCGTAVGRVISGEGILSLGSAFLAAGSSAVVASLWPVDDSVTADLMLYFYSGLAEGYPIAEALARACGEIRNMPQTQHPFYWSGFVLLGDGEKQVVLEARKSSAKLVFAGFFALVLLLAVLWDTIKIFFSKKFAPESRVSE